MTANRRNHLWAYLPTGPRKFGRIGLLLVVLGVSSCEAVLAASKPSIQVRFEMDRGFFSFRQLSEDTQYSIVAGVCEGARQRWGFVDWCDGLSDDESAAVWTVRLAVESRPPAESDEDTKKVSLEHYIETAEDESDSNSLRALDLYDHYTPKPTRDPDALAEKILWGLTQQFQAQSGWEKVPERLKTIRLTDDLRIFTRTNGKRYITVPYRLCDLQLKKKAAFRVELTIDEFFPEDNFDLTKFTTVPADPNEELGGFIVGKISRWEVDSVEVEPDPTDSADVESDQLLDLVQNYDKKIYIKDFDIGTGCVADSSGNMTDPGE